MAQSLRPLWLLLLSCGAALLSSHVCAAALSWQLLGSGAGATPEPRAFAASSPAQGRCDLGIMTFSSAQPHWTLAEGAKEPHSTYSVARAGHVPPNPILLPHFHAASACSHHQLSHICFATVQEEGHSGPTPMEASRMPVKCGSTTYGNARAQAPMPPPGLGLLTLVRTCSAAFNSVVNTHSKCSNSAKVCG